MNRCIQCTRCVRFTHEIAKTGELGFFNRGARVEIGTFPGKELDNDLATCVVDICPVGALTSTRFRFAERVFYLEKRPSICTGCEVGCNVTIEHRRSAIKRYKPRFNVEVNDYWMCDYGRSTFERYKALPRLASARVKPELGAWGWDGALDWVAKKLGERKGTVAVLGSGFLSTEEAYLLGKVADLAGTPHRSVPVDLGKSHTIPNTKGGITGREAAPNRRGAELAGLAPGDPGTETLIGHEALLAGDAASRCEVLIVADSDFGAAAHDPQVVERLRKAKTLVVFGWADTPLAKAADVALPVANAAERDGTFVNVEWRVQRCEAAFPAPGETRPLVEALADLLARLDPEGRKWTGLTAGSAFDRLAGEHPAFAGLHWHDLPATGSALKVPLKVPAAHPALSDGAAAAASEASA
jgi:NADH-quinone oxidoreductase subunit G